MNCTYVMGKLTIVGFFSTKKLFLVNLLMQKTRYGGSLVSWNLLRKFSLYVLYSCKRIRCCVIFSFFGGNRTFKISLNVLSISSTTFPGYIYLLLHDIIIFIWLCTFSVLPLNLARMLNRGTCGMISCSFSSLYSGAVGRSRVRNKKVDSDICSWYSSVTSNASFSSGSCVFQNSENA